MLRPFISWIFDIIQVLISAILDHYSNSNISNEIKPLVNPRIAPLSNNPKPLKPNQPENNNPLDFVSSNLETLTEQDFVNVAHFLNVEPEAIKTVFTVESKGSGYLASNRPKILFEAHHFSKYTNHIYDQTYPNISSRVWNRSLYKGGEAEYNRLSQAIALSQAAALKSASWGLFQILGSNYQACGFGCVEDFVKAHVESHFNQLQAFASFLKSTKLDNYLRSKDWTSFAKYYNGPGYAANQYDKKLKQAYEKLTKV